MYILMTKQISITESKGVEGRGSYYNSTGVVRDVMQNRGSIFWFVTRCQVVELSTDMIQVLALLTMERPKSFLADDLRKEKVCS